MFSLRIINTKFIKKMEQKLYDLKIQILKDISIKDDLKKDLSDKIFQIEHKLAINYSRCCKSDSEKLSCSTCKLNFDNWDDKHPCASCCEFDNHQAI